MDDENSKRRHLEKEFEHLALQLAFWAKKVLGKKYITTLLDGYHSHDDVTERSVYRRILCMGVREDLLTETTTT